MKFIKAIFGFIFKLLLFAIIFGFLTAGIDYLRMKNGDVPIFNVSSYDSRQKIQTYRGIFYVANRKVWSDSSESLTNSSNLTFQLFQFSFDIERLYEREDLDFSIESDVISDCNNPSYLYYADENVKVYFYCLNDIKIQKDKSEKLSSYLKKDYSILDDIDGNLAYMLTVSDGLALAFSSREDSFTNNGLTMYRCQAPNINDVYFAPVGTPFQSDFCTYKDDDFSFLFSILDETPETLQASSSDNIAAAEEVFYEDENYSYVFSVPKSEYVFLTVPAIRGREAKKIPVKMALSQKLVTIDDLREKGLSFNAIKK